MNPDEYTKMYELEDHYWWFVGRRTLAIDLLKKSIGAHSHAAHDKRGHAEHILDLGCGTGVISRELDTVGSTVSLDFSELALKYCCKRGLSRCVKGDGTRLPLQTGEFNGILALDIFEHIEDDVTAFSESLRVLAPGGVLVLSVPAFASLWGPHDVALHHFRRYRTREVRQKLESVGFEVTRCSYSVFFLFPVVVITRLFEKRRKGPAKASLPAVAPWMNKLLIGLQAFEARLIVSGINLPWGSSVVAVARKRA